MTLRDSIDSVVKGAAPYFNLVLLLALSVALVLYVPAKGAAVLLGIIAGALLSYNILSRGSHSTRLAVLWGAIAIVADAAYARLNDQTPVTVANAFAKIIDACVKLADPLIRGTGISPDPRLKVSAVTPDFVWAVILTLAVVMAIGFPARGATRR
ncbi:MAG: hypothetical protein WBX25_17885 [Rhodomicrobium sp.]